MSHGVAPRFSLCHSTMAGDDYGENKDTEFLPASRWEAEFGAVARKRGNEWGVVSAVFKWCSERNIEYKVTYMRDCYGFPSWYFVKPNS